MIYIINYKYNIHFMNTRHGERSKTSIKVSDLYRLISEKHRVISDRKIFLFGSHKLSRKPN